jgi:hypothetical protein
VVVCGDGTEQDVAQRLREVVQRAGLAGTA